MGRNRLPDNIKALRGTNQPCRINGDAAIDAAKEIQAPKGMSSDAKKIFIARANQLKIHDILTPADIDSLILYANSMATAMKAQKALQEEGYISFIKDEEGSIIGQQVNLWHKILQDSIKTVNLIGMQFGFTPASRAKISSLITAKKENNDFAEFEEIE